jgi:DNA-binding response OmpR family regulator
MPAEDIIKDKKILICDDDKSVSGFLGYFLKSAGYSQIEIVSSGEEVLEKIAEKRYDLILLDIMLPGMNGIEILRRVKQIDSKITVVMITGFPEDEMALEAVKMGAYDYIVKPFDLEYLKMVLLTKILLDAK